MSEKCIVYNQTKGDVSFGLAVAIEPEDLEGMPSHKRRRAIRNNITQIVIPYGYSVDLVKKTGLPVEKIKVSGELMKLEARGAVRVEIAEEKDAPAPKEAPSPPPAVIVEEPEPAPEPEAEAAPAPKPEPPKAEPKKASKKSKRGRKKG